jgi:hypothetical protein
MALTSFYHKSILVVLGDFNTILSYTISQSSRAKLINFLISHNMFDIANYTDNTTQI